MRTGLTAWATVRATTAQAACCIHMPAALLAALMCPNQFVPGKPTMTDRSPAMRRIAPAMSLAVLGRKHRTFKAMRAKPFRRHSLESGNTATFIARAVPTNVARKVAG
ncbi:hypothetical protein CN311_23435 [Mesorhizobium sanjuanii]|uniref:Secreted protein n=1 Tax=Mesorhizobium sanjuanii TaxID=2037900 RepID=A0A2A6F9Y2_9HYPH|nr:hypothetical protein CN311_23435 [Mesorhizobium sanjuanii]